jgi:hypothetical protein
LFIKIKYLYFEKFKILVNIEKSIRKNRKMKKNEKPKKP